MYKDRGIMKWAPFDALVGFRDLIEKQAHMRLKKDKPILSDDALDEMDRQFKEAIHFKQEVFIDYFIDGYIKHTVGLIVYINLHERIIKLDSQEMIKFDNICALSI